MVNESMRLSDAIEMLSTSYRYELADYAFGDSEFIWKDEEGKEIASGYRGRSDKSVTFGDYHNSKTFKDSDAQELFGLGKLARFERNDTGEDY